MVLSGHGWSVGVKRVISRWRMKKNLTRIHHQFDPPPAFHLFISNFRPFNKFGCNHHQFSSLLSIHPNQVSLNIFFDSYEPATKAVQSTKNEKGDQTCNLLFALYNTSILIIRRRYPWWVSLNILLAMPAICANKAN